MCHLYQCNKVVRRNGKGNCTFRWYKLYAAFYVFLNGSFYVLRFALCEKDSRNFIIRYVVNRFFYDRWHFIYIAPVNLCTESRCLKKYGKVGRNRIKTEYIMADRGKSLNFSEIGIKLLNGSMSLEEINSVMYRLDMNPELLRCVICWQTVISSLSESFAIIRLCRWRRVQRQKYRKSGIYWLPLCRSNTDVIYLPYSEYKFWLFWYDERIFSINQQNQFK